MAVQVSCFRSHYEKEQGWNGVMELGESFLAQGETRLDENLKTASLCSARCFLESPKPKTRQAVMSTMQRVVDP